jgi:glucosamine--fructose-6-phosphate aminotransferase (isomerizing)
MPGELTRAAIAAQPEWLRAVPTGLQFPEGVRRLFTGCGTSFHAAQTGGEAVQALELVLRPERDADLLVIVSHEGETPMTLEAARAWRGSRWLVTGAPESPLAALCEEVLVCTPELEQSWCHTASYTCAVAAIDALAGNEIGWLGDAAEAAEGFPASPHERFLVAGAGRDWPTAQEAVLKLREGAFVAAEAYETEQLLHGFLAAVDESVRAFVLEGEGRAAERAAATAAALRELGCDVTLVPTRHPAVDIVPFQKLTVALAELRGVEPDRIHRDDERWARAAAAAKADNAA